MLHNRCGIHSAANRSSSTWGTPQFQVHHNTHNCGRVLLHHLAHHCITSGQALEPLSFQPLSLGHQGETRSQFLLKACFFVDGRLKKIVEVRADESSFAVGSPTALFDATGLLGSDATRDGQRRLVIRSVEEKTPELLVLVVNSTAELSRD